MGHVKPSSSSSFIVFSFVFAIFGGVGALFAVLKINNMLSMMCAIHSRESYLLRFLDEVGVVPTEFR